MKVHTVLAVHDGMVIDLEVHGQGENAARRGLELARDYGLAAASTATNESLVDFGPEVGSAGFWRHHWSDSRRDVIVAECEVE